MTPVPPIGQRDPEVEELDSLALSALWEPAGDAAEEPANEPRRAAVATRESPAALPALQGVDVLDDAVVEAAIVGVRGGHGHDRRCHAEDRQGGHRCPAAASGQSRSHGR